MRIFNTAGPVRCDEHYCLSPLDRLDQAEILSLIEQKKYFVLHAPRQTGKTSSLMALMEYLNQEGRYCCLYVNVEMGQSAREDVKRGVKVIMGEIAAQARRFLGDSSLDTIWADLLDRYGEDRGLNELLSQWAAANPKPVVLLLDEIDALVGDTLISVLRQLRAGYSNRPALFPQSIVLCGVRDVRDYRLHSSREKAIITGGSAFNIKAKSLRLGNFSREELETLYQIHTEETGQAFEPNALEIAWEATYGQPWLVNALGYEVCFEMPEGRDRSISLTSEMMETAKERLILRRDTHLDQLVDKLKEERVRLVIEPILAGDASPDLIPTDDIQYVNDLGLIRTQGQLAIANRIYQEIIPRELTYSTQLTIAHQPAWYIREEDGRLDMLKLIAAFQQFFREHSEHWIERFDYKEAGPQLLLQAFLQRIVNPSTGSGQVSGGRVEREYGLGRKRTDLLVLWPVHDDQIQRVVMELKIRYGALSNTIAEGLEQTWKYMDRCGAEEGHLIIFDRTPDTPWEQKIFRQDETFRETPITVWGM